MGDYIEDIRIIEKFRKDMRGVFTLSDLKAMFPSRHVVVFYRKIAALEKAKILRRFARGLYVTEEFDICAVSQKICPESYISFETVLARDALIGTVPERMVRGVKVGKRRMYRSETGIVEHLGVAEHLYFGFETIDGINFATREKALLDTLYFHNRGTRFYFDIYSDVNLSIIDLGAINKFLTRYKNPKFIKFATQYLKGNI